MRISDLSDKELAEAMRTAKDAYWTARIQAATVPELLQLFEQLEQAKRAAIEREQGN